MWISTGISALGRRDRRRGAFASEQSLTATEAEGTRMMTDMALSAFARAWVTTLIASSLLIAALVVFGMWGSSVYSRSWRRCLGWICDTRQSTRDCRNPHGL